VVPSFHFYGTNLVDFTKTPSSWLRLGGIQLDQVLSINFMKFQESSLTKLLQPVKSVDERDKLKKEGKRGGLFLLGTTISKHRKLYLNDFHSRFDIEVGRGRVSSPALSGPTVYPGMIVLQLLLIYMPLCIVYVKIRPRPSLQVLLRGSTSFPSTRIAAWFDLHFLSKFSNLAFTCSLYPQCLLMSGSRLLCTFTGSYNQQPAMSLTAQCVTRRTSCIELVIIKRRQLTHASFWPREGFHPVIGLKKAVVIVFRIE
jgi:hypothetical protein